MATNFYEQHEKLLIGVDAEFRNIFFMNYYAQLCQGPLYEASFAFGPF